MFSGEKSEKVQLPFENHLWVIKSRSTCTYDVLEVFSWFVHYGDAVWL